MGQHMTPIRTPSPETSVNRPGEFARVDCLKGLSRRYPRRTTGVAPRDKTDDSAIRMKSNPETTTQEVLAGLVERVTFHNAENGFCVLRAKARGHRDLVTVVGHAAIISAGEWITASGEWINDRAHGQQFKARFLKTSAPSSIDGIEKYLGSGMIRGIGPVYAKKMVKAFGDKVFDVIEAEPNRRTSPSTPAANGAVASRRDGGDDCGPAALALARGRRSRRGSRSARATPAR